MPVNRKSRSGLATGTILYAEDDAALRQLCTHALVKAGYSVLPVENGLTALNALRVGSYDLLITDNEMPKCTGLELVARARAENLGIPVIMTSGTASPSDPDFDSTRLALEGVIAKPFGLDELVRAVHRCFSEHQIENGTPKHTVAPPNGGKRTPATPRWGINE